MVYLNGRFLPIEEAVIPVLDRGFIFGDGVYEMIPVYSRVPFRLDEHLSRLGRSLAAVRIDNPHTPAQWASIIAGLIGRQAFEDQGVYLQVTRGVAKRDHAFPAGVSPTVFLMSNPFVTPAAEQIERGVSVVTAADFRWHRCDVKSVSLVGNVLLRQISVDAGAAETILFRDGKLTEASASNVFIVTDGTIVSPPKSNLLLPGITCDVIGELASAAGMPLQFRDVTEGEFRSAAEVWLTSSGKEVLAVVEADGRPISDGRPGPVFRRMYALYQEYKRKVMRAGALSPARAA